MEGKINMQIITPPQSPKKFTFDLQRFVSTFTLGTGITGTLDDNGKLTISGTGAMPNYDNDDNRSPFYENTDIKTVVINTGVTSIGEGAFESCTSLTSITFADSSKLTSIGKAAFYGSGLTSITIPSSVTSIGEAAFYDCDSLTSVTITVPTGKTLTIGKTTFSAGTADITSLVTGGNALTLTYTDPPTGYLLTLPDGVTASGTSEVVEGKTLYKGEVTLTVGAGAAIGNATGISNAAADANGQIKFTPSADVTITAENIYYSVTASGVNVSGTKITISNADYYKKGSTVTLTAKTGYSVQNSSVTISQATTITPTFDTTNKYVFGKEGNYTLATSDNVASNNYPDLTQVYEVTLSGGVNITGGTYTTDNGKTYAAGEITLEAKTGYSVENTKVTVNEATTITPTFDTENHYVFGTEGNYTLATADNVASNNYPDLTQAYALTLPENMTASGDVYLTVDKIVYVKPNATITLNINEDYIVDSEIVGATNNGDGTYIVTVDKDTEVTGSIIPATEMEFNSNKTSVKLLKAFKGTFSAKDYKKLTKIDASANSNNLQIIGNDKNSAITGSEGNDTITGGTKADTLNGGEGNDSLTGGNGKDIFIFSAGNDTIADYTAKDDKISVKSDLTGYSISGKDLTLNYAEGSLTVIKGAGVEINFAGDEKKIFRTDGIFNARETEVTVMSGAVTFGSEYKKLKTIYDNIGTTITGNSENNNIYASEKGSTLNGGGGKDTLNGSTGADVFIHTSGKKNSTTIKNYADGDTVSISDVTNKQTLIKNVDDAALSQQTKSGTLTVKLADGSSIEITSENYKKSEGKFAAVNISGAGNVSFDKDAIYELDADDNIIEVDLMANQSGKYDASKKEGLSGVTISGAAVDDKKSKLNIIGTSGNDSIIGGNTGKGNTLQGGAGNDTLTGTKDVEDTFSFSKTDTGNDVIADFEYLKDTIEIDKGLLKDDPLDISGSTVTFNLNDGSFTVDTKVSSNKILFKSGNTLYWWDDSTNKFITPTVNKNGKTLLTSILKDYKNGKNDGFCVVNLDANIKDFIADKNTCKAAVFTSSGPQK